MNKLKIFAISLGCVLVAVLSFTATRSLVGASSTAEDGDVKQSTAHYSSFFDVLQGHVQANYPLRDAEEMYADSTLVVSGRLKKVKDGRLVETSPDSWAQTVIAEIRVDSVLRHDGGKVSDGGKVYVQFYRGGAPIEMLAEQLSDERLILYLIDGDAEYRLHPGRKKLTFRNNGRGVPKHARLYRLASPQGVIQDGAGAAVQLMDAVPLYDPDTMDFDSIVADISRREGEAG